jgi:hypothetical protein
MRKTKVVVARNAGDWREPRGCTGGRGGDRAAERPEYKALGGGCMQGTAATRCGKTGRHITYLGEGNLEAQYEEVSSDLMLRVLCAPGYKAKVTRSSDMSLG